MFVSVACCVYQECYLPQVALHKKGMSMAKIEYIVFRKKEEYTKPYPPGTTQELPFICKGGCVVCAAGSILSPF